MMETNNLNDPKGRLVINCTQAQAVNFFNRLKKIKEITLKSYKKATETVFQERYFFTAEFESISIVHETRSNMLIITASDHILSLLKGEFELAQKSASDEGQTSGRVGQGQQPKQQIALRQSYQLQQAPPRAPKQQVQQQPKQQQLAIRQPQQLQAVVSQPPQKQAQKQPVQAVKQAKQAQAPVAQQQSKQSAKGAKKQVQLQAKQPQPVALKLSGQQESANQPSKSARNKNGEREEMIKGVSRLKLDAMLGKISSKKNADYVTDKNSFREGCEIYVLTSANVKMTVKYYADKFLVQLNGQGGKFFDEVASMLSAPVKVSAAENKLKVAQRKLNKMLPHAFDIMSEQAKADFCIGMIDINNDNVRLSDYSMLLVPPYRGLECLISDLQKAKGIDVKMIGQAYEKLDGKYVLKSGYRKRMNSHVYCEVMSALYIEYFEKRNFYAHSDITGDSLSRIISDKSTVKSIFNGLVELIEYNIFKLKEIRFWQE